MVQRVSVVDINNDGLMDMYISASLFKNSKKRENLLYINAAIDTKVILILKTWLLNMGWLTPHILQWLLFLIMTMKWRQSDEKLIDHKDPEKAMALEHNELWKEISINHLEGRSAGFFCYGDEGGDEMDETGRPKILQHKNYFDPDDEPFENERDAYAPLVWQCRYGGVEVPDNL